MVLKVGMCCKSFFIFLGSRTRLANTELDIYLCILCSGILCSECASAVVEIHSGEELPDRAMRPSPGHNGLNDTTTILLRMLSGADHLAPS